VPWRHRPPYVSRDHGREGRSSMRRSGEDETSTTVQVVITALNQSLIGCRMHAVITITLTVATSRLTTSARRRWDHHACVRPPWVRDVCRQPTTRRTNCAELREDYTRRRAFSPLWQVPFSTWAIVSKTTTKTIGSIERFVDRVPWSYRKTTSFGTACRTIYPIV